MLVKSNERENQKLGVHETFPNGPHKIIRNQNENPTNQQVIDVIKDSTPHITPLPLSYIVFILCEFELWMNSIHNISIL